MTRILFLLGLLLDFPAYAQQSASYKIQESVLNNGGNPAGGTSASSASYRIRLDAIGEGVVGTGLTSASYGVDAGFVGAYPPPGEVLGFRFDSKTAMSWNPERSIGTYQVYREALNTLPGNFGACFQSPLGVPSATDTASPVAGSAYFYLTTARNRLGEEGTKGYRRPHAERPNPAPCP